MPSSGSAVKSCLRLVLPLVLATRVASPGEEAHPGLAELAPSQSFLRRELPAYRNYAFQGYSNYPNHTFPYADTPRAFYGQLGDYLLTGYELYSWNEHRAPGLEYSSGVFKDLDVFRPVFDHVVVAHDGHDSWGYSALVGDGLIARLTPLTLSKVDLNGVRLDVSTPYLRFTGLGSRLERQPTNGVAARWAIDDTHYSQDNILLLGGRAEADMGALRVGLNGVNMHLYRGTEPGNSLKGVLRSDQPFADWIVLRFSDDSPADGRGGAVVQEVRIVINGTARPDLRPLVVRHRTDARSQVGTVSRVTGEFRPTIYYRFVPVSTVTGTTFYRGKEIPLFADYMYRARHEESEDVSGNTNLPGLLAEFLLEDPGEVLRADGEQQLIFLFDLSREPYLESVEVEALLAGDYRVDAATLWEDNPGARNLETQFKSTFYRTAVRAEGNVQDLSNIGRVRIRVGENTALFTYSSDLRLALPGLEIRGEYARSALYSRFPARSEEQPLFARSAPFVQRGEAYFIHALHWFGRGNVGAEFFSVNPDFRTEMRTFLKTDTGYGEGDLAGLTNQTMYWRLVQDNEDGDRFADAPPGHTLGSPKDAVDVDPDGVFPGQDEDNDGIPDVNRNFNQLPDYEEPFLMFDVEPNQYAYGMDRNNNDEPDVREDDLEVDYPYEYDQRGYHLFTQMDLWHHWSVGAGRYAVEQVAGGGRNKSTYALLNCRREGGVRLRRVFFENHLRRVQDDIADPYNVLVEQPQRGRIKAGDGGLEVDVNAFFNQERDDPLLYRNSYVNETYLEGQFRPHAALNLVQKLWVRFNWQQGGALPGGRVQRERRLDHWSAVSRADYTHRWGRLRLQPQLKFMLLRQVDQRAGRNLRSEYSLIPIVRLEYPLMPRTALQAGVQGAGPWPYRFEDRANERNTFTRRTAFVTVRNRTSYFGYDLYTIVGFERDRKEFEDRFRQAEGFDTWSFAVRAVIGFTEYARPL